MTSISAFRKAGAALIALAFVAAACGGGTPTTAPVSTPAGTQAAPSTGATEPPASQSVVTLPPATGGPVVDPADDLKIAAPYSLEPLSEQIAELFVNAMKQSVGPDAANLVQFGFRTAAKGTATEAWVIVMAFPGLPIGSSTMLDNVVTAATQGGGTAEELNVGNGHEARIINQGGQAIVVMLNGDELLMIVGTAKKNTVDAAKAIAEAN